MWFRPGSSSSGEDRDRFRVASFRSRIRGRKPSSEPAAVVASSSSANGKQTTTYDVNGEGKPTQRSKSTDRLTSDHEEGEGEDRLQIESEKVGDQQKDNLNQVIEERLSDNDEDKKSHKDHVILTDRKYKNNRIEKSSSRTKVHVVPVSGRKISAPPVLSDSQLNKGQGSSSSSAGASGSAASGLKKNGRSHSHLNLNSLLKYRSLLYTSGEKKLTSEDFDKIRKKSLSEVAKTAQPNCEPASSVKLIRHEYLEEADEGKKCDKKGKEAHKVSLSERISATLNESTLKKKNRSKSKAKKLQQRRGSRRLSVNSSASNSAANIPVVLLQKLENGGGDKDEIDGWFLMGVFAAGEKVLLLGDF